MKQTLRSAILIIGTLGWWGFVYPEFCMTPGEPGKDCESCTAWECKPEEICIKSRFYEYVCQVEKRMMDYDK